jgi:predicted CXXCH cytochrome family protein
MEWIAVAMVTIAFVTACAHDVTRYRMARFFFDGVPEPGEAEQVGYAPTPNASQITARPPRQVVVQETFAHTPYRMNRCGGCHSADSGGLLRALDRGLCLNCHASVVNEVTYAHGPTAVHDCSFCHHYHASAHEHVLHVGPNETCYRCHAAEDLTEGDHHTELEAQTCITCHDPHGGDNRLFLRQVPP